MPPPDTLVIFLGAALALNLTPGPDMLYVIARGAGEGRLAGVASALGIGLGCFVHIALLAAGLSALLARVPAAYDAIRWAGALYLLYLGVRALTTPSALVAAAAQPRTASLVAIAVQGAVTNILNPKVALFFLAFIPQFVRPEGWSPAMQIVFLGLLLNTSGTLVNLGVALGASRATNWLRANTRRADRLQRLTGIVFIGLDLRPRSRATADARSRTSCRAPAYVMAGLSPTKAGSAVMTAFGQASSGAKASPLPMYEAGAQPLTPARVGSGGLPRK